MKLYRSLYSHHLELTPRKLKVVVDADKLRGVGIAGDDELDGIVKAAQDAATILKDRMAWVSFRDAGKARTAK